MSLTKTVKNNTFDDCFTEVDHTESISTIRPGSMRLFYLNVRSGKIKISDLEKFTMLNIGRYVFSRAKQEQYEKAGNLDAVSGAEIMELFSRLNKEKSVTILQVTHSAESASYSSRIVTLKDKVITG